MRNEYEIRGDVTAIIINSKKFGRLEAIISTKKLQRAIDFPNSWSARKDKRTSSYYVCGHITRARRTQDTILLHRWITNAVKGMEVDHRNHETLDNTDENLRVASVSENQQNRKGASSHSTSGYRGVCWHKASKKWNVQLVIKGVKMSFGYFADMEEANKVAIEARKTHMPFVS